MLQLDRKSRTLLDARGQAFDPAKRLWQPSETAETGGEISLPDAVRWLQQDSGSPCRVPVGVIGPREASASQEALAEAVGHGLARLGLSLLCGGAGGVMAAACRGVEKGGGLSIGLLPDGHWEAANPHVSVPLASGLGVARNAVIARASLCLIAVGGGYGTLSEMAFALQFGRPVFALPESPVVAGSRRLADWPEAEDALCRVVLALDED